MLYLIYIFFLVAIFLIVFSGLSTKSKTSTIRSRLPAEPQQLKRAKVSVYFRPLFLVSNFILDKLHLAKRVHENVSAARLKLTAVEFFSLKLVLMLGLAISTFFIFGKIHLLALIIALVLGYIIPDLWLRQRINLRKQAISQSLPESIDLLALCIEAGLDFTSAMEWLVRKTRHTPMIEELAFVLEEVRLGRPRSQALKEMSKRINIQEVSSFVHSLVQAERMGTPAIEAFSIISEDSRLQRFRRGERIALKAPIKILIPLIFCILPVIAIVVGGPILLQFMQGNLLKGF